MLPTAQNVGRLIREGLAAYQRGELDTAGRLVAAAWSMNAATVDQLVMLTRLHNLVVRARRPRWRRLLAP